MSRKICAMAFGLNLLVLAAAWLLLPARIATHFGPDGGADAWGSKHVFVPVLMLLHSLLFMLLWLTPRLLRTAAARWVNLPAKDYWLRPENRAQAEKLLRDELTAFGAALFLFMLIANGLTVVANRLPAARLSPPVFLGAFGAFILYTAVWSLRLFRVFRRPST